MSTQGSIGNVVAVIFHLWAIIDAATYDVAD